MTDSIIERVRNAIQAVSYRDRRNARLCRQGRCDQRSDVVYGVGLDPQWDKAADEAVVVVATCPGCGSMWFS